MTTVTISKEECAIAVKALGDVGKLEILAKELLECLNDEMKFHGESDMAERTLETIDRAIDILYGGETQ
jgi:hypothetical protein